MYKQKEVELIKASEGKPSKERLEFWKQQEALLKEAIK